MAKKAELEAHRVEYNQKLGQAKSHFAVGEYSKGTSLALEACNFADAMMQFERKYEDREFKSVESVDLVLRYCPLLLDYRALASLESLLKSQRRIDRNTAVDLAGGLRQAQARLQSVYRLLDSLERKGSASMEEIIVRLGGPQAPWRKLIKELEDIGIIRCTDHGGIGRVSLTTRMSELVHAKCSSCGVIGRAEKRKFLNEINCPKCRTLTLFVMLEENRSKRQEG